MTVQYRKRNIKMDIFHEELVADNTDKCILGRNFKLANTPLTWWLIIQVSVFWVATSSWQKNTPLTWAGVKEVAVHKQSLTPFRTCHRAVKTEMMLIPPFSKASIPAMVEPRPGENGLCARGLSTKHATDKDTVMGHPRLTLQLINPTKAPTKIKHIYQVANCECVERVPHPDSIWQ